MNISYGKREGRVKAKTVGTTNIQKEGRVTTFRPNVLESVVLKTIRVIFLPTTDLSSSS